MHCRFTSFLMIKVLQQSVFQRIGEFSRGDFSPTALKFITSICVLYNSRNIDVYYFYQGHRKTEII